MKNQFTPLKGLIALSAGLFAAASLSAQTLFFLNNAPVPTNGDVYNLVGAPNDGANVSDGGSYADGAANDGFTYVALDRPSQGQTFTTGLSAGKVTAIWIRQVGYTTNTALTYWSYAAGGHLVFRITSPSQTNTAGFVLDSETYAITGAEPNWPGGFNDSTNGLGIWMRYAFSNTINLSPNTVYGFDVTCTNSDFFESWGTSNAVYAGGTAYRGSTVATPDNTLNPLVGSRAFLVEFNGGTFATPPVLPPSITNQPANTIVPEGANGVFTVGVTGTGPFNYQWYFNTNTALNGQTNATLALAATSSTAGFYSVIVTNSAGNATSSVARLAFVLPSVTTNLNFSAGVGTILDINGVGTPFSVRLAGTGSSIPTDDPDLLMTNGVLSFTSPTCDFNGQLVMNQADAIGINLSSIGFNGTQDFTVTAVFSNLTASVNYDQAGVFAGSASTNFARGGLIFNSDFANLSSYGVATPGNNDAGIATGPAPVGQMIATIARASGVWSMNVNGSSVTPNFSLAYLNRLTDMTAGVFTLNTSGVANTTTITGFSASLFGAPKLTIAQTAGNVTLNWNVIGLGLQSNPNLANTNGWASVPGTFGTNQLVIPIPATGSVFYRLQR